MGSDVDNPLPPSLRFRLYRPTLCGAVALANLLCVGVLLLILKLCFPTIIAYDNLTPAEQLLLDRTELLMVCLIFPVGWLSVLGAGVSSPPCAAVIFVPLNAYVWGFIVDHSYHAWTRARIRRRQNRGLCLHCGYDLRATPDRCPECGMAVARPSAEPPVGQPSESSHY